MATTPGAAQQAAPSPRARSNDTRTNKQAALEYIAGHVTEDSNDLEAVEVAIAVGFGRCLALASDTHFERCIASMRKARELW